ncbi:hypothetical protein HK098_006736 [Nowakowskiella sp. JEL0407]|nr:hypothetical protein HK098_006736 [Nowakowskiella sp. JEL0407]
MNSDSSKIVKHSVNAAKIASGKRNPACDRCHSQKLKCDARKPSCDRCLKAQKICTFDRKKLKTAKISEQQNLDADQLSKLLTAFLSQKHPGFPSISPSLLPTSEFPNLSLYAGLNPLLINPFLYSNPDPVLASYYDLPYSLEVIDDMVYCFFKYCNFWPFNFIHPTSFYKKRYHMPRSLLAVICSRGSYYSKYTPMLAAMGEIPGERLLQHAEDSLDILDVCMETLITVVHISFHAFMRGKGKSVFFYARVLETLMRKLKVYIDPDVLETEGFAIFNPIEKEMRRRIITALKILGHFSSKEIFIDFPMFTVKEPLPYQSFEVMKNDHSDLIDVRLVNIVPAGYRIDTIAHEIFQWKDYVTKFYCEINLSKPSNWDVVRFMIEAMQLQNFVDRWHENLPSWVKDSFTAKNIHVGLAPPQDPTKIPWQAPSVLVLYHGHRILIYRFLLAYLYSKVKAMDYYDLPFSKVDGPTLDLYVETTLKELWDAHTSLMNGLKNCLVRLDPKQENMCSIVLSATSHSAMFCYVMAEAGATSELKETARLDYEYLKAFYASVGKGTWKMANGVLEYLAQLENMPDSERKLMMIQALWTGGMKSLFVQFTERMDEGILNF